MGRGFGFSMSGGVASMLAGARREDKGFGFTLSGGDLDQMYIQYDFLSRRTDIVVGKCGVYPAVRTKEDYVKALQAIFDNSVKGWWNYERELIAEGICSMEQYDAKLGRVSYCSKTGLRQWLQEHGEKVDRVMHGMALANKGLVSVIVRDGEDNAGIIVETFTSIAEAGGVECYEVDTKAFQDFIYK